MALFKASRHWRSATIKMRSALPHRKCSLGRRRCLIRNAPQSGTRLGALDMRKMSTTARDELVNALARRYAVGTRAEKTRILDELNPSE